MKSKKADVVIGGTRTVQDGTIGDVRRYRVFYADGRIVEYVDASLALDVYFGLGQGIRAAFRAAGDETPVYPHDYVDRG